MSNWLLLRTNPSSETPPASVTFARSGAEPARGFSVRRNWTSAALSPSLRLANAGMPDAISPCRTTVVSS